MGAARRTTSLMGASAALSLIAGAMLASPATAQGIGRVLPSTADFNTSADFALLQYGRERNVTVLQRARPEYQALGIRRNGFLIYPRVTTGLGFTDNVFASEGDKDGDGFALLSPSVVAQSDWTNHSLRLAALANGRALFDNSDESRVAWALSADGVLNVRRQWTVSGGAALATQYEERTSTGSPVFAAEPLRIFTPVAYVNTNYTTGRTRLTGELRLGGFNYHDVDSTAGGRIDQDYRDQTITRAQGKAEYAVSPDTAVFGQLTLSHSDYDPDGALALDRTSDEVRALAGGNFDVTALIRGEVGVGYIRRDYDRPDLKDIKGLALLGQLEYLPTPLTTVTARVRRAVDDASIPTTTGGFLSTRVGARVDHELLRNVILSGEAAYEWDDYRGLDRDDDIFDASVGGQYLLTRSVGLGATLSYTDRKSSGPFSVPSFDATQLVFTIVLQR